MRTSIRKQWRLGWLIVYLCAVSLAVGASGNAAVDKTTATATSMKVVSLLDLLTLHSYRFAIHSGSYSRAGLQVQDVAVGSGSTAAQLFLGGQVDMAVTAGVHAFLGRARGQDIKIVQTITTNSSLQLITRKNLNIRAGNWGALRGKKCGATGPGSDTDLLLRAILESKGLEPGKDVTFIYTGGISAALTGLKADRIDCFLALPGMRAEAIQQGVGEVFFDLGDDPVLGKGPSITVAVHGAFLRANRAAVKRFVHATLREVQGFYVNPAAHKAAAKTIYPNLSESAVAAEFDRFVKIKAFPTDGRQNQASYAAVIKLYTAANALPSAPKFSDVYDNTLLPKRVQMSASVGPGSTITMRRTRGLAEGDVGVITVKDASKTENFRLVGPGVRKATGIAFRGTVRWSIRLKAGTYTFRSDRNKRLRGKFVVVP